MTSWRRIGRIWVILVGIGGLLIAGGAVLAVRQWRLQHGQDPLHALLETVEAPQVKADAETESRIKAFCGDCHAVPRPESFHRDAWHDAVEKGFSFYLRSGRTDLAPPPMGATVAYFRSRAPEQLSYPEAKEADTRLGAAFTVEKLDLERDAPSPAAIACLQWLKLGEGISPVLLASDLTSGEIKTLDLHDPQRKVRRLAQLNNPCHVEPCDLDGDGRLDLLVADLGSSSALDHDRGRVVWLRQSERKGAFEEVVLASRLGRVADVRPIDTHGSGKLDLVVAEFGWCRTGRILLLRNAASPGQRPRFEPEQLDPRTGTIHVPVCDLNRDGRPDFLALVSNESECVDAFLNQGNGTFYRQPLWRAPDLTFGSSGIQLVDLDRDGDLDILFTNGDAFDNMYLSPWHGIQWLENLGGVRYAHHRIADMPGACVALPGDLDGDGDLDILAVSFLPANLNPRTAAAKQFPSIVLLEQTAPGCFVRHTLETGFPCHSAALVGDFNHDGRLDFAVGNHWAGKGGRDLGHTWLTVWWNQPVARAPSAKPPQGSPSGR